MNLFEGKKWRHKHRERTCGHSRGRRGEDELRKELHCMYKTDNWWKAAIETQGALPGAL